MIKYNLKIRLIIYLLAFFISSLAYAASNSGGSVIDVRVTGGSLNRTYAAPSGSYQAWRAEVNNLRVEGHGSAGPAGGKGGVNVCLSPNSSMWAPGSSCWTVLDAEGAGNVGDSGRSYPNWSDDIGGDPYPALGWVVVEVYANDADVTGNYGFSGRTVSIDDFYGTPDPGVTGTDINVRWNIDLGGANFVSGNEIFSDGVVGNYYENDLPLSGNLDFTPATAGDANFTLNARGPSSGGVITVSQGLTIPVNLGASPPGPFSLNGACTGNSSPRIELAWSSSSGATNYRIERRVWSTGSWNSIGNTSGTNFTDSSPAVDADNYYRVFGVNSLGENVASPNPIQLNSNPVNCGGTPPPVPTTPPPGPSTPPPVPNSCEALNNSSFVGWQPPPVQMSPGETRTVSITMRNTGTTTWDYNSGFQRLSSVNPADNTNWGLNRIDLPALPYTVPPGAQHTFLFNITAPTVPGNYNFQWQMIKESPPGCRFGEMTPNFVVNVQSTGINQSPTKPSVANIPSCSNSPYTGVVVSWTGTPNPAFGFYVDIADNTTFALDTFYNRNIPYSGVGTPTSVTAPTGFNLYDNGSPALALNPGTTYYARVFNQYPDNNSWSPLSDPWNVPSCDVQVNVSSNPSSGNAPLNSAITANVSGSATGNIDYRWDCDGDGVFGSADSEPESLNFSSTTNAANCSYSSPGNFTPGVRVTRQGLSGAGFTNVNVGGTLGVTVSANPSSGNIPLDSLVTANVSGSATGNIDYRWDCDGDGVFGSADSEPELLGSSSAIQSRTCNFSSIGTYNTAVRIWRGGLMATGYVVISGSNPPPSIGNVTITEPNYCTTSPSATINWNISGGSQNAFEVQIDDSSTFASPVYSSCPGGYPTGSCAPGNSSNSIFVGPGYLDFAETYWARVRVWDSSGTVSSWKVADICNGPGCIVSAGVARWNSPVYPYPQPNFSWTPPIPARGINTQFTDLTVFSGPVAGRNWLWNFGDGTTSVQQNPLKSFGNYGTFDIFLTATDAAGQSCSSNSRTINVQKPIPLWKEVLPR